MNWRCKMKKYICQSSLLLAGLVTTLMATYSVQANSHIVAEGDSLYSIADQYGVDPYQLAEANG
ncbi:TPA: LysM peptidoglycan-binding domain-containing protein, partial [Streptococcus suis]